MESNNSAPAFTVKGKVTTTKGKAVKQQNIIAFDVDVKGAAIYRTVQTVKNIKAKGGFEILQEAVTDKKGNYSLQFYAAQFAKAERKQADIIVYAVNKNGSIIGRSKLVNTEDYTNEREVNNWDIVLEKEDDKTEYETTMNALLSFLKESEVALLDLAKSADQLQFVAKELDIPITTIQIIVKAEVLRTGQSNPDKKKTATKRNTKTATAETIDKSSLSHELLYALGRQNVSLNFQTLYKKTDAELKAAIAASVNDSIIKKYNEKEIKNFLEQFPLTQQQHAANTAGNLAYPTLAGEEELSRTFYDNYNWLTNYSTGLSATYNNTYDTYFQTVSNINWPYAQANVQSSQIKGMVTGTRTKIIPPSGGGGASYLYSIPIYDEKGRPIQSQSTNITGGVDISTTQYTWAGQPLVMINRIQKALPPSGGVGGGQETVIVSQNTYDELGRILKTEKKISNPLVNAGAMAAYKTIAENKYNKLGQLINKTLGTKPSTTEPLAKLDYEYNIRGWLTAVNKNFVTAGNTGANNDEYFGMQLGYDKDAFGSFTKKQYNGNIAGSIWRSAGDGIDRKYDYDYDNANRLLKADFTQHNGANFATNAAINFNVKMGDGIDPNSAYDYNGNIKQMQQWGLKINQSEQIDNLSYNYIPNTNKLLNVIDANNIATTKLGDFRASEFYQQSVPVKTNTTVDYTYDVNGNLKKDLNKDIRSITYNHLNLPQTIEFDNGRTDHGGNPAYSTINYTYDAAGNKLAKQVVESFGDHFSTKSTTYLNGIVYEDDVLQFIPHEEGRIRFTPSVVGGQSSFAYDYMLKDHLGNVRMVLTEEQKIDKYPIASLEPSKLATEKAFYEIQDANIVDKYTATGIPDFVNDNGIGNNPTDAAFSTTNSTKLYMLNSNTAKTGLGITLKVMAGDKVDVFGKSYYYQNTTGTSSNSNVPILNILTGFLSGATGAAATNVHGTITPAQINPGATNTNVNNFLNTQSNQSDALPYNPRAFINVLFFDEQFNIVDYKVSMVGSAGTLKDHFADLQNLVATKSGFVYIYCSNESPVNVYFDNMQVVHTRSPILEESHYYPFGLEMKGISSSSAGGLKNKYKFGGKELQSNEFSDGSGMELYDFHARNYDQQIGRFWGVDPLASKYPSLSPYCFVANNPIYYVDPDGREIWIAFDVTNKDGSTTQQKVQYKDGALYGTDGKAYTGGNEYATKVMGDLNQLSKDNTDLGGRICTLQESKNIHTIKMTANPDDGNANSPISQSDDEKGISTGSNTTYNPDKETNVRGDKRVARAGLAHELLGHGYDSDQGKADYTKTDNGIPMYEVNAVNMENRARAAAGNEKKTTYGGKPIPEKLLDDTHKKKE